MGKHDRVNVLLVDDQPGKLLTYEVMLKELGENLVTATSADEALQALLKVETAVILIDVCMPDLDGFELARMIREHPRFRKTAIILVSAVNVSQTDHLRGYDVGAVDYVSVPVVPDVLRAKVRVFAELFRKTKQLEELNRELERRVDERTAELSSYASRLVESERSRDMALAAGNMGSWEYDAVENRWAWDEGHSRIFGIDPPRRFSGTAEVSAFFNESDWARLQSMIDLATPGNNSFQSEMRIRRSDGEVRYCLASAAVTFGADGKIQRLNGVTIDITDRRLAENRQALLAREVDHRARNTLAVVQSIVRLTKAADLKSYTIAVDGRVRALALAHDLLSQSRWEGADIARLVSEEVAPYRMGDPSKIAFDGPSVILAADKAQAVALAIHELATNAAKYGALSSDSGRVSIAWRADGKGLALSWKETGGPVVQLPRAEGFGTRIINASVREQHQGRVEFDWRPEGLHCTLSLPSSTDESNNDASHLRVIPSANGVERQVLVVEDEALVSLYMSEILAEMGYSVSGPYSNVSDALIAAKAGRFAGAVLDVYLNGELVYPLAEVLTKSEIPFVFVTGYAEDRIDARFSHAPVLQKPLTRESLEGALDRIFGPARQSARA